MSITLCVMFVKIVDKLLSRLCFRRNSTVQVCLIRTSTSQRFIYRFNRRYAIGVIKRLTKITDFDTLIKLLLDKIRSVDYNINQFFDGTFFSSSMFLSHKKNLALTTKIIVFVGFIMRL